MKLWTLNVHPHQQIVSDLVQGRSDLAQLAVDGLDVPPDQVHLHLRPGQGVNVARVLQSLPVQLNIRREKNETKN